ncbi:MAG TPA: bifunctional precorrin-2 dehydrogenase/sirohydrochlorin ferrochelatase [Gaiellaceae bacterium]|nr:bifunctional precorrin-2 dehydrogenase/sirohydrochlorin ferrochelatase [Gaiellaceae bacterium]
MTGWYPVCLDLRGRRCLVVGGGRVALEKTRGLLAAGAAVAVVAPEVVPELRSLPVELVERPFADGDVAGRMLVVSTTGDDAVAARVAAAAERAGVFCNAADVPALCSFILPAVHREGQILVAVSTGGASPALAQWLRARIAELVRPEHAQLAERLAALRPWAKRNLPSYEERRDYFRGLVERALA